MSSCGNFSSIPGMGLASSSPLLLNLLPKFICIQMQLVQWVMGLSSKMRGFKANGPLITNSTGLLGLSITRQELYPIYLSCMLWAPHWANRRICFHCDNQAAVAVLFTKSSKVPCITTLVRPITLQTLMFNFTFTAKHVPGIDNSIADSLSRFQMSRFRLLAPAASPTPCPIPPFLTRV